MIDGTIQPLSLRYRTLTVQMAKLPRSRGTEIDFSYLKSTEHRLHSNGKQEEDWTSEGSSIPNLKSPDASSNEGE